MFNKLSGESVRAVLQWWALAKARVQALVISLRTSSLKGASVPILQKRELRHGWEVPCPRLTSTLASDLEPGIPTLGPRHS